MASPVVAARNESATTTAATSHVVSLPASIASGNLLFIWIGFADNVTGGAPSGWTKLGLDEPTNTTSSSGTWFYRQADGSEGGSATVTSGAVSTRSAHLSWRITGHADPATQAPQIANGSAGTSASPQSNAISPTGGSKDYLFFTAFVQDGEEADDDTWTTATPTNYGNLVQKTCGVAGGVSTNVQVAAADRQNTTATETPGTFTTAQSLAWGAVTVAVHPGAAAAPGPATLKRRTVANGRSYDPWSLTGFE